MRTSCAVIASSWNILRYSPLRPASSRISALVVPTPIPRQRLLSTLVLCRHQRPQPQLDPRWRNLRWNSSAAAAASPSPAAPISPTPPSSLDGFIPDDPGAIADVVATIPPLQHGDLQALGLCHWTPAGLIQYSFELINVWTGLPWFHTFVAATLFWRIVIFPFAVVGMRHSTRLRPVSQLLNEKTMAVQAARRAGDTVGMQRASLAAAKVRADAGVSMGGLLAPMIQFPISIGMFFGVKKMCDLPVLQLTQSGFSLLPDLTQPGPYFILPILVAASGNLMLLLSSRDMDTSRPAMGHLMNVFRVVSVLAIYWMDRFSSGLLVTILVTSLATIVQTALFRIPAVRTALNIPQRTGEVVQLPTMRESLRYYLGRDQTPSRAASAGVVRPYIPPKASKPAPVPRTLEVMAQQAQAGVSAKSAGLYEDTSPAPKKAGKKTKAKAKSA
ncbi:60Kd inner membrane protein-domain-containing protein [Mycena pura]|uniref:60Kd inner membrane protein-domain-containing protein n=1 Tax=Mycena pura TaxID=153505 RepID=A0AAD6VWA3_9AGAR|nr:60Kd inner membrane protein-domain-containing protein [Mycena pura]